MAKRYRPQDLKAIIKEVTGENDRARAVVGGSLLDGALDYAITARLLKLSHGEESVLFRPGGPFHSCDQKIKAGHALGLFGSTAKADMETINEIRNIFAHNMNPVSFSDPDITALCEKLRTGGVSDPAEGLTNLDKFVIVVHWIIEGLVDDVNEGSYVRLTSTSRLLSD